MDASSRFPDWLLVVLVPASSLLGLLRPMVEGRGFETFFDVWRANLAGDIVFVVATIGSTLVGVQLLDWLQDGRTERLGVAMALAMLGCFFLTWAAYTLAWSWTWGAMGSNGSQFLAWTFDWRGLTEGWQVTLQWGWIGLVCNGVAVPLLARRYSSQPRPTAASAA